MSITRSVMDRTLASREGTAAYAICERLTDAGHEAWWVGGCVRDMALGKVPADIDIATAAKPEVVLRLFSRTDDSFIRLGIVTVAHLGEELEVATFREDSSDGDGRRPETVVFCDKKSDAKRRDFTVNALYWNPISRVTWDPFDGLIDMKEKLVRFIGDPDARIRQDALRMLRAIRLRAHIGGQYHPDTYAALHRNAAMSQGLSGSRVLAECEKILLGEHPEVAFEDLWETGILKTLMPQLHRCKGIAQPADYHKEGDVWEHTMLCLSCFTDDHDMDVRFAALLHDIGKIETFSHRADRIHFDEHASASGKIAFDILSSLQVPKKRIDKIRWLVEHHMMMSTFFSIDDERKAHWYYHPWFVELLQLFRIDIGGTRPSDFALYERIVADYNEFLDAHPLPPKALLSGEEIMAILRISPGEEVGRILSLLKKGQIEKRILTKRDAKEFLESFRNGQRKD